jgi:hypothetical protein
MKPNGQPHSGPTHAPVSCFIGVDESRSWRGVAGTVEYDGKGIMQGSSNKGGLRRAAADFALAFILFWVVALSLGGNHGRAYAVSLPTLAKEAILPDSAAPSTSASLRSDRPGTAGHSIHKAQTSPEQARVLLSFAFAVLAAINLGFWRHLRRVYASPRRGVWRRG